MSKPSDTAIAPLVLKKHSALVSMRGCLNRNQQVALDSLLCLAAQAPEQAIMLVMLAAIGQLEREMMLERQREGIRIAKDAGAYKGRKPTARVHEARVLDLLAQGKTKQAIASDIGIGISSVYRILKFHRCV